MQVSSQYRTFADCISIFFQLTHNNYCNNHHQLCEIVYYKKGLVTNIKLEEII